MRYAPDQHTAGARPDDRHVRARVWWWRWLALICAITLPWCGWQDHSHWDSVIWLPFVREPASVLDVIANTLLFVPFGSLFVLAAWVRRHAAMAAVGLAGLFGAIAETAQVFSHGRVPSTADVASAILGAAIGALAVRLRDGRHGRG
jgi:hypothetical protein